MSAAVGTNKETESPGYAPLPPPTQSNARTEPKSGKTKPKALPPYHVVLLDDADHSHEYVIEMMRVLFGYPSERGYQIAQEVDTRKKAIVFTTHKEFAELKRDQIHAYGVDLRVATCAGSMSACIMPAGS
jgi:ATP-dependent Clp protease adaptor protein ClpS